MARKESPELERDTNDVSNASNPHLASAASLQATLNSLSANNGQFSFVDPSVMMVTNAAATIAAVAASAVQQMTQGKATHAAGGGSSPVPHGLAGAFQGTTARNLLSAPGVLSSAPGTSAQLPPHVAALLSAGGAQHTLSSLLAGQKTASAPAPTPAHVHATLQSAKVDTSSALTGIAGSQASFPSHAAVAAMASGSMNNVVVPGMQNWSLEQLGETTVGYSMPFEGFFR